MRSLFVEAGGRPERNAPHYFILGKSEWFANLYPNTRHVRHPLFIAILSAAGIVTAILLLLIPGPAIMGAGAGLSSIVRGAVPVALLVPLAWGCA